MNKKVTPHASRLTGKPHTKDMVWGKVVAVVPAAGVGKRFSTSTKKPFVDFLGIPLLIHTLKRLHAVKSITEIIPVLRKEDIKKGFELMETYNLNKVRRIAVGGRERKDSVYNALRMIENEDLILIHDGVRPLVTQELVKKLLSEISNKQSNNSIDGVILGIPVKETLKEVGDNGFVHSTKKREKFWTIQTPQVFRFNVLKKAYDSVYKYGFYATDDSALVERIGGRVKVILGDPFNIKVTTPEDVEIVKYLLTTKRESVSE